MNLIEKFTKFMIVIRKLSTNLYNTIVAVHTEFEDFKSNKDVPMSLTFKALNEQFDWPFDGLEHNGQTESMLGLIMKEFMENNYKFLKMYENDDKLELAQHIFWTLDDEWNRYIETEWIDV